MSAVSAVAATAVSASKEGEHLQRPTIVDLDISELQHACAHLERSNKEMGEFIKDDGPDPDLLAAIEENVHALKIKRQRIEDLKECITRAAMPGQPFLSSDPGKEMRAFELSHADSEHNNELGTTTNATASVEPAAAAESIPDQPKPVQQDPQDVGLML